MSIYDKFQTIANARKEMLEGGIDPFNIVVEEIISPTEAIVNGQRTILAGTNNYLGLTFDPECIESARTALAQEGTGTTGSRMANGSFGGHLALEKEIAQFFECPSAIVFSTGYQANLGVLSSLTGPGDVILIDSDSHASIYDGCRLSGAEIVRFRHNDPTDLEKRLRRLGEKVTNTLIMVEGIYSMLGDRAPLAEIVKLKESFGAHLVVDEAHSLGVLGPRGRGLAEEVGVEKQVDFIVGTFSKSLGSTGGFCVSPRPELELIRYMSRPYIFTASLCPSVVASTRTALQQLKTRPILRSRLWENSRTLYTRLQEMGFTLGPEITPVVAAIIPNKEQALVMWKELLQGGVYVNLMVPPATPNGMSLLRCSVSAAHSDEQIHHICQEFSSLRKLALTN